MTSKNLYVRSLSKLRTVLAQKQGGRLNGALKTPWLSCILIAAVLNLILYCLQAEIFLQKKKMDTRFTFLMETLTFQQLFFIHNFELKKKLCKIIGFALIKKFFLKCPTLHIYQINSFLDIKRNKRLLDNKSLEPLDATVSWMNHWLWGYISLYILRN